MSATELMPPRRSRRTMMVAVAVLVATFAAGVLAGIAADRTVLRRVWRDHTPPSPSYLASRLEKRLDLTPDQTRKVEEILTRHQAKMNTAWSAARKSIRTEIDAANAEIDQILTPPQRQKFEELKMRMRSKNGSHRGSR